MTNFKKKILASIKSSGLIHKNDLIEMVKSFDPRQVQSLANLYEVTPDVAVDHALIHLNSGMVDPATAGAIIKINKRIVDDSGRETQEFQTNAKTNFKKKILAGVTMDKINSKNKNKASNEITEFINGKYFSTLGEAISGIESTLQKYGFSTEDFSNWASQCNLYADSPDNNPSACTKMTTIEVGPKAFLKITVYRMPSGNYEVTAYIS